MIKKRKSVLYIMIIISLILVACNKSKKQESEHIQNAISLADEEQLESCITDTGSELVKDARYRDSSLSAKERAIDLLSYMTLDEKVGQMIIGESKNNEVESISENQIGGLLEKLSANSNNSADDWLKQNILYQNVASKTRLGIPLFIATEDICGNTIMGPTIFPNCIGLGATDDSKLMEQVGKVVNSELTEAGFNWNIVSVSSYLKDSHPSLSYEGYGQELSLVTNLSNSYLKGFYNKENSYSILSTLSLCFEDGKVTNSKTNIGRTSSYITMEGLTYPYKEAIKHHVKAIYIPNIKMNGKLISTNRDLIMNCLKKTYQFSGIVFTEADIDTVKSFDREKLLKEEINSGIDMLLIKDSYENTKNAIINLVGDGLIRSDRIDEAVTRILTVKFKQGLFDHLKKKVYYPHLIGSSKNRSIAREAVRKSIVLLKNKDHIVNNLKKIKKIAVYGTAAKNISIQCGRLSNNLQNKQEGTTFYQALEKLHNKKIYYSEYGDKAFDADVCIIVVGEELVRIKNGLEYNDKRTTLKLSANNKELIKKVKLENDKKPIILVLYSANPIIMNQEIDMVDSFIAAWLPGTEGEGITDVLFGDYDFTGTLSYPWPKNEGQTEYAFHVGYGLKKSNHKEKQ
ncbi:glycoside hydrolase family 3 protein [Anaeromicropila herbilytica]|uniref:beta-glucosidase n=1 Tax=Anaeromicropila herbilytica TaxID=2785025 RepID=A0A7R7IDT6_9FIRM|nr:glycoside hydrolase family 3 N-terminal domain-containing protein [Anaeromicropila herbilytica]BCN30353.1 beta-glucosidase [Anaeromicropila herbilytica]